MPNKLKEKEKKNMKYKPLLLAFLLLLPVGLLATTRNAQAHIQPTLSVYPHDFEFQGPCIKGNTFPVSVILWNTGLTGFDIYAFDFVLDLSGFLPWAVPVNNTIVITSPWPSGSYFLVANETSPAVFPGQPAAYFTDIHLAMTAMPPGKGLIEVNQTVLTVTMKFTRDVCWPTHIGPLEAPCFTSAEMSSDGTKVVPIPPGSFEADCGLFELASVQPSMELVDADAFLNATDYTSGKTWGTEMIVEKCISKETDVEVHLNNITGVYGFGFTLNFDPMHKEVDVQKVTIKAAFPPPYESLSMIYTPTDYVHWLPGSGYITISVIKPSEKPSVCGADVVAIDIVLHTIDMVKNTYAVVGELSEDPSWDGGLLPSQSKTPIYLTNGWILAKCSTANPGLTSPVLYAFGNGPFPAHASEFIGTGLTYPNEQGLIYGVWLNTNPWGISGTTVSAGYALYTDIWDWFHPSKYDLNLDCVVDMQDLLVLAPFYMLYTNQWPIVPKPGTYADLYEPDPPTYQIDIFDFVAVAKHFGPVDP